jgi:dipicolinate synthase subunit B
MSTRVGFALTGSFCTFARVLPVAEALTAQGCELLPIMSETAYGTDTRFGVAATWRELLTAISGQEIIHTIAGAEPIGPRKLLDVLVVAPCTGNTLAKLACGITDTAVTMACKAHLRNGRPILLAPSTNDGLSAAAVNIGSLMARRNVFFVPYGQDDPGHKPASLVSVMERIPDALYAALEGRQLQPMLLGCST